jgi:hypothetical protein
MLIARLSPITCGGYGALRSSEFREEVGRLSCTDKPHRSAINAAATVEAKYL